MKQRTLSIIKPDAVKRGLIGEVIRRFEKEGFKIVAMKMVWLSKKEAEGFYAVHRDKGFFNSLTDFMSSGPSVVMVLEGEDVIEQNRRVMGATDPAKAEKGTIRRLWGGNIQENIVHGSDSEESADFEIGYFFSQMEIKEW